jgi:hypothetical protein
MAAGDPVFEVLTAEELVEVCPDCAGPAAWPDVRILPVSDPETLSELAALLRCRRQDADPRTRLDDYALGQMGDMVMAGRVPALGWWRRMRAEGHLRPAP